MTTLASCIRPAALAASALFTLTEVLVRHGPRRVALGLLLAASPAFAQVPPAVVAASPAAGQPPLALLVGRWVRPDGGYLINIKAADASGRLDASYANPTPLPFYAAEAKREGAVLKLFFELRAGGYNGSTYTLIYDPASDQLKGVYYQAVQRQKYEVAFARAK